MVVLHILFGLSVYPVFYLMPRFQCWCISITPPFMLWLSNLVTKTIPFITGIAWLMAGLVWLMKAVPGLNGENAGSGFSAELCDGYLLVWFFAVTALAIKGILNGEKAQLSEATTWDESNREKPPVL